MIRNFRLLMFLAAGYSTLPVFAAPIIWSGPFGVTTPNGTFLTTNPTLINVAGAEAWGGGNTTVVSNGVSIFFQQGSANGSNGFATTSGSAGVTSGNIAGYLNPDANLQKVLGDFEYDGTQNLTFNNLQVGQKYIVQLFGIDDRSFAQKVLEFYQDPLGNNSPTFSLGSNSYELGTFIADAATQSLTVHNANSGSGITGLPETNLNAAVLYTVAPEPGSILLAGLGLVSIGLARRRLTVR